MVSVIMPAWRAGKFIGKSIDSVVSQTYDQWELIVVSEDEESEVAARQYKDERIRVLRNVERLGVAKSRNRGIAESKGGWLAFLDADDIWREDKLAKQLATNALISFTASAFIDSRGKAYNNILHVPKRLSYGGLLKQNLMSCSSVMARRDVMQPFPETSKPIHEDYVTWLRILQNTDAVGIDEPLLIYRLQSDSKSGNRVRSGLMTYNAYREVGFSSIKAALMTARYAQWSVEKRRGIYENKF